MIAALAGIVAGDAWISARGIEQREAAGPAMLLWCGLPITLLVLLLIIPATYEMGRLCRAGGLQPSVHWAAFVSAGLVLLPWIEMQEQLTSLQLAAPGPARAAPLATVWLAGGLLGAAVVVLGRRTTEKALTHTAVTVFIFMYIGVLASFAVRIRCLWPGPAGAAIIVYYLLTVKSGDIGAFFVGRSFGRRKLAPWLSPGKTVEGAAGAIAAAALVGLAGMAAWNAPLLGSPAPLTLTQGLLFGVVMAVAGHVGDLVESAMKRDTGIKDSGAVVPAFGGLLDILDSPLFTAPLAWWLLTSWAPIG